MPGPLADADAGVRAYTTPAGKLRRFWAGYYNLKAIDHDTGGVLATTVVSASTQEHIAYLDLYEQLCDSLGARPKATAADRGFSVSAVFERHTRDGVASVIPWRKTVHEPVRQDHLPRYDRHGVPHCKHCGMEGVFHRFQHDSGPNDEPRLWFRCAKPGAPECQQVQPMLCTENWRSLLPLWRTSPAYQVLRISQLRGRSSPLARAVTRSRATPRPIAPSVAVSASSSFARRPRSLIEWLTICHRQGWLGGPMLNANSETALSPEHAASYGKRILNQREALGLSSCPPEAMPAHQAAMLAYHEASSHGSKQAIETLVAANEEGPPE